MAGTHPEMRHDGTPFQGSDSERQACAGQPLGWRGALLFVKGDWAEFSHSLGFASWSHGTHPCLLCKTTRER
eukprot:8071208-Alexandrium_andersonii.AAC.1